jgi:hypothetical protein
MNSKKIVAIHQPNFFPWLSFFDKIIRSHVFIVLDNVQFPKTGGCWINRVKLLINGKPNYITIPIVRAYKGFRNINEMEIHNSKPWKENILKTIEFNYRKAPFFEHIFPILKLIFEERSNELLKFNLSAIYVFAEKLRIDTSKFFLASKLQTQGKATEMLITLINSVHGTSYIFGGGAANYQDNSRFENQGIELIPQNFKYPEYNQINTTSFVSGLSVIDALMNCGFEGVIELLHKENHN